LARLFAYLVRYIHRHVSRYAPLDVLCRRSQIRRKLVELFLAVTLIVGAAFSLLIFIVMCYRPIRRETRHHRGSRKNKFAILGVEAPGRKSVKIRHIWMFRVFAPATGRDASATKM
jgi:hypothetical protein